MRFKIDENLPREVADILGTHQHDAVTVTEQGLNGGSDSRISIVCRSENRVLITLDLDFADIRSDPPADSPGIIVLRPEAQEKQSVLKVVSRLLPLFQAHPLAGHLWIVDESAVRIRGT